MEDTGILKKKAAVQRKSLRRELEETEKRLATWLEAFETGAMAPDLGGERLRELTAQKKKLQEALKKVVPITVPPYLYTQANIQRFQRDLETIFLSKETAMTKNYLQFLVEKIIVTDKRVEISLKRSAAITMMSAEARKEKSEAFSDAPDLVLPTVVGWLRSDVPCKNLVSHFGWTPVATFEAADAPLRTPSVVARLAQAEHFERLLATGAVHHKAELARRHGLARSRVTQLMSLLKLHPRLLERVRTLEPGTPERLVTERKLRPLARLALRAQLTAAANKMPTVFGGLVQ